MLALERLSPLERAAFLLHDVFGESFEDIAAALGRDAAACRQLASRARANVRTERPRFTIDRKHGMEIAAAFFQASPGEGLTNLSALLASGVRSPYDRSVRRPVGASGVRTRRVRCEQYH